VASSLDDALEIVDISSSTNPTHAGSIIDGAGGAVLDYATSVFVSGKYAYVTSYSDKALEIIDISNPASPTHAGKIVNGVGGVALDSPYSVYVSGKYAYVASFVSDALEIIDISGIDAPSATIGNLAVGSLNIWENANIFNDLSVGNGLNVGGGGIFTQGRLGVNSAVRFSNLGAGTLVTDSSGNITVSSDEKLKDIQGNFEPGLSAILQITPINYKWNATSSLETEGIYSGFSSQNVQKVIPEAVGVDSRGYLTLSDRPIIAALVNAVKEQQTMISPLSLSININTTSKQISLGTSTDFYNVKFNLQNQIDFNTISTNTLNLSFNTPVAFKSSIDNIAGARSFIFDALNFNTSETDRTILSLRSNNSSVFSVSANGDTMITGNLYANSIIIGTSTSPGDLAERVDINPSEIVKPGDVLMVDDTNPDMYKKTNSPYEPTVSGVVSTNPLIIVGNGKTQNIAVMAMTGRVPVNVTVENGMIKRGDLLISSNQPGKAMKYDPAKDDGKKIVGIIGIALENAGSDTQVLALIRTGWVYNKTQAITTLETQVQQLATQANIDFNQDPQNLTVGNDGPSQQIAYNLDLNNYSLLNVKSINQLQNNWSIDDNGILVAKIITEEGEDIVYGVSSQEVEINLSGEGQLINGEAIIEFDEKTKRMIDFAQNIKVNLTLTSGEGNGIYVSEKATDEFKGFKVKEMLGGTSGATFDWFVIAKRKVNVVGAENMGGVQQENNTPILGDPINKNIEQPSGSSTDSNEEMPVKPEEKTDEEENSDPGESATETESTSESSVGSDSETSTTPSTASST
jgi:hypothetical protein